MKQIKTFLTKHWLVLVSTILVLALIPLMIWVHTPSTGAICTITFTIVMFSVLALCTKSPKSYLVTAINGLMMWGVSAMGWSYLIMMIPICICVIDTILCETPNIIGFLIVMLSLLLLSAMESERWRDVALSPDNAIEVVITNIEKRAHDDVIVVVNTEDGQLRILPINSKVEDAWRLEEGDSLKVNIHNNEIIAFEKK